MTHRADKMAHWSDNNGAAILRGDFADGVWIRAAIEPLKQGQRDGAALIAWVLLVELRRMDDIHLRFDRKCYWSRMVVDAPNACWKTAR